MFERALFIFRRDLRLHDNTGLIYALEHAKEVVCAFIFTPKQITDNPYRSDFCLQFMLESLEDLEREIEKRNGRLLYFFDEPEKAVLRCIKELHVDVVVVNKDYTPYSASRDNKIETTCHTASVCFKSFDDLLLYSPEQLLKGNGAPYTVFTPFYMNAREIPVVLPQSNPHRNYAHIHLKRHEIVSPFKNILPKRHVAQPGGRREALKLLSQLSHFTNYDIDRDYPYRDATTHLSPHLKFTTVSAREVYANIKETLGAYSPLIRSLYWRDFFTSICYHFPHVMRGAFKQKYDALEWDHNKSSFKKWCEGMTGFPIVDAGMRELNHTGYMHNRVRMIVASFLVKDLHIHWQWGEKYFASHLIDYDPAVNNGNWQWAASTGCDAQPYFRIFNPWLQQAKFDPACEYIKKWIPELISEDPKAIHTWYKQTTPTHYPLPFVDHSTEAKRALAQYKSLA